MRALSPPRPPTWLLLTLALVGCGGGADPQHPPPPALAPAGAAEPAQAGDAPESVSDSGFELRITTEPAQVGNPASAEVELLSKAPFKCNDKYPFKFKAAPSTGLRFASPVVSADSAKIEAHRVVMKIAFTPTAPGKQRLAGQFAFSICTADQCRIEKRDLSVEVDVRDVGAR